MPVNIEQARAFEGPIRRASDADRPSRRAAVEDKRFVPAFVGDGPELKTDQATLMLAHSSPAEKHPGARVAEPPKDDGAFALGIPAFGRGL